MKAIVVIRGAIPIVIGISLSYVESFLHAWFVEGDLNFYIWYEIETCPNDPW